MENKNNSFGVGMSVFSAIFFTFGFATTFIITLSAKVKDIFTLSEFEAQLLTGAFFITYLVLSIPTGYVIKKIGYKGWPFNSHTLYLVNRQFVYLGTERTQFELAV